jgi:hypothetical protein
MCARFYISAIEGCPPSRSDYYAYREKRWQEMTEEMNNRD